MTGPRDYGVGTERALFRLSRGTCYHPDCLVPVLRMIDGQPIVNVEIGHIHGARPGSARYDPAMTDRERASFDNLLLLCTAHHKLIDRLAPDDHPPTLLREWKLAAEVGGGLEALRQIDGLLSEDRLGDLIEQAVAKLGPTREIEVELEGGFLHGGSQALSYPLSAMAELLRINETMRNAELLVVVTVRNTGFSDVTVNSVTLHYDIPLLNRRADPEAAVALLGRNDFPWLNPDLPKRLLAGESMHWLTRLNSIAWIVQRAENATFTSLYGRVHLGSGEAVESARLPWDVLPLELLSGDDT